MAKYYLLHLRNGANQHYFNYYAAHEVCHAITYAHDDRFRAAEAVALSVLGLRPVYANGGAGPYVVALTDLSGFPLCVRIGKANPTLPPGLGPVLC